MRLLIPFSPNLKTKWNPNWGFSFLFPIFPKSKNKVKPFFPQIEKQSKTLIEAFLSFFLFSPNRKIKRNPNWGFFRRSFFFLFKFDFFCSLLETHLLEFEIIVEKLVNLFAIEGSLMPRIVEEDFNDFKGREVYFNNW